MTDIVTTNSGEAPVALTRDQIRALMFAAENKVQAVEVITLFGQPVEVRQPTLNQLNALSRQKENDKVSPIVRIMIEYCYMPGTNDKVFEQGDAEQLMSMPTGKWLNDFNEAMEKLSGVDVKAAEKNSSETD